MRSFIFIYFLLFSLVHLSAQEEPDYTKIRFKSYLREYKKEKPNQDKLKISKNEIETIVTLLGDEFYTESEIEDIAQKVWLALRDPEKFDFVYKDLAVRSLPNWSKPNYKGELVLEPNQFRKLWTKSNDELPYYQRTIVRILAYYGLMGYSEDAKATKKDLGKMPYAKKIPFRPVRLNDWTSAYLNSANTHLIRRGLTIRMVNFDYFICKISRAPDLMAIFEKLEMMFESPTP